MQRIRYTGDTPRHAKARYERAANLQAEYLEPRVLLSAALASTPARSRLVDGLQVASIQLRYGPEIPATVVGNDGVFVGPTRGDYIPQYDIYDESTGAWSTRAFPAPLVSVAAATTAGNEAIFNSYEGFTPIGIFNANTDRWSKGRITTIGRAATAIGDSAFFAGGPTNGSEDSSLVNIYNARTGLFSTASLSEARNYVAAASVGDTAIFAGGSTGDALALGSSVVDMYDTTTRQWSTAALSVARYGIAAVTVGGDKVVFAGGQTGPQLVDSGIGTPSNAVDIYDASLGTWSTATLSVPDPDPIVAISGEEAFFAGGYNHTGRPSNIVDVYNATTGAWSTITFPRKNGYGCGAATGLGDKVLFASGDGKSVYIYDTTTGRWTTVTIPIANAVLSGVLTVGPTAIFESEEGVETFTDPSLAAPTLGGAIHARGRDMDVSMSNSGTAPLSARSRVRVYASSTTTLGRHAILIGSARIGASLAPAASLQLSIPIITAATLSAGSYHLIAVAGPHGSPAPFAVTRKAINLASATAGPAETSDLAAARESLRSPNISAAVSPFATAPIAPDAPDAFLADGKKLLD